MTGASGWIGSAVVPELLQAGHEVVGLARSDASASALEVAGAEVHRGSLDNLEALGRAAAASDGVIHLAYKHQEAFSGDFATAIDADRHAIEVLGNALAGTGRPLIIASGLAGLQPGELATEDDVPDASSPAGGRSLSERAALALAGRGVRSASVRLPPTVHGDGDIGFVPRLIGVARERRASGYIDDGANRWPAVHRLDAARLFRLAVEGVPAGSVLHGIAEEGVPTRAIAETIGRGLGPAGGQSRPAKWMYECLPDVDATDLEFEDLSFGHYMLILQSKAHWDKLEVAFGPRRQGVLGRLRPVNNVRNVAFHFRRPITAADHELLANARDWLLARLRIVAARRRGDAGK